MIHRGFDQLIREGKISDDDYLIISDVDEIPNPEKIEELRHKWNGKEVTFASLVMDLYYYNMQTKLKQKWDRAKMIRVWKYKEILSRVAFNLDFIRNGTGGVGEAPERIENGGKHLSYFGDVSFIKNKIQNFSHQELNLPQYQNDAYVERVVKERLNLFGFQMELEKSE